MMRTTRAALCLAIAIGALAGCEDEARPSSGLDADPWTPMSEAALEGRIDDAMQTAAETDRMVLLDFVADWCEDCREVVRLSHLEPARSVIEERYVVVYVEVGRFDRHRDLIEEHRVDRIATLVVIDPETELRVARTTLEPITGAHRGLSPEDLARWLRDPS